MRRRGEEEKKKKKTKTKTKKEWSTAAPSHPLRLPLLLKCVITRRPMVCFGLPRCAATCSATVCLFFCHLPPMAPNLLIIYNI